MRLLGDEIAGRLGSEITVRRCDDVARWPGGAATRSLAHV